MPSNTATYSPTVVLIFLITVVVTSLRFLNRSVTCPQENVTIARLTYGIAE